MMSSFIKAYTGTDSSIESQSPLRGTQLRHGIPYVSLGVPSLDYVIGGSVPVESLFMLEEDVLGTYSRVIAKYFLAEGIVNGHGILLASLDDNPEDLMRELPTPTTEIVEPPEKTAGEDMKIAWRYKAKGAVESSFGTTKSLGRHYDLSTHMDEEIIRHSDVEYWSNMTVLAHSSEFENPLYFDLLSTIRRVLSKEQYKLSDLKEKKVLRICITSLGSPVWMSEDLVAENGTAERGADIKKFMYCLRMMLRGTTAVAMVTIPTHLMKEDSRLAKRLLISADTAVRLESFADSDRENPLYKEYHGVLRVPKLSALNGITPFVPPTQDLAFKLRRKKFVVEKLHLPPELQETSEREQDDVTSLQPLSCASLNQRVNLF